MPRRNRVGPPDTPEFSPFVRTREHVRHILASTWAAVGETARRKVRARGDVV